MSGEMVVEIPAQASAEGLIRIVEDCLAEVRIGERTSLATLRQAVRCLGPLLRIARLVPTFLARAVSLLQRTYSVAEATAKVVKSTGGNALPFRSIQITCLIHLVRLVEQQRTEKHVARRGRSTVGTGALVPQAVVTTPLRSGAIEGTHRGRFVGKTSKQLGRVDATIM